MIKVFPAIDILSGRCVRLAGGDYDAVSVYEEVPTRAAGCFLQAGALRLHVVDLDAAKSGKPVNTAAITDILALSGEFKATVQVGGGLRNIAAVEGILDAGADYVILGTAAVRDASFRQEAINTYPQQVILGLDARDERLAVSGWLEEEELNLFDFLEILHDSPPAAIIYTDISRDGLLNGVNIDRTSEVASKAPCPVIASGGVRDINDLLALEKIENLDGVIVGRALYTGDIDLADVVFT